jgi:hypothetical protein
LLTKSDRKQLASPHIGLAPLRDRTSQQTIMRSLRGLGYGATLERLPQGKRRAGTALRPSIHDRLVRSSKARDASWVVPAAP